MPAMTNVTRQVLDKVIGLGVGATFTSADLRKNHLPNMLCKHICSRLSYFVSKGVIEKVTKWDGTNYVTYRVKEAKRSSYIAGRGLHKFKALRVASKSPDIVTAIDTMSTQLMGLLEVAKAHPQATIKNFTTSELVSELSHRASVSA